ncbi:MAG: aminotransferase class I/II-fold pyridoxal phosphate-dependent enzyme [Treponema sp.]|nr:aminotransferase class I/II-fold pyridoxal phosphate-dependent enzyme [Treponema sp.]
MSKYWNNRIKNLSPYIPGEQPKDRKFVKLNTNENPYPPSPKVIEAIKKAANGDLRLYPDPTSTMFREAAAVRYGVKPDQVFAGNGSDEILAFAFGAFFENANGAASSGTDAILFPDITYSFYPVYAGLWDIQYRTIPLCDDFSINCDDYKIPCGGIIFPNPNAPTGIPIPLGDIISLAEHLEGQGRVLVVDEAYCAFGESNGKAVGNSVVPYIGKHKNILTVHTMSKQMSLAGLRFGFAIGSEELIEGLYRIKDSFNSYPVDRLALAGAAAAITDTAYYDDINGKVMVTRERVAGELRALGCNVLPSAANFIFVQAPGISGADFFSALRERGILVRHFNKERIADFLRVTIGTDEEMDVFLDACRDIIRIFLFSLYPPCPLCPPCEILGEKK